MRNIGCCRGCSIISRCGFRQFLSVPLISSFCHTTQGHSHHEHSITLLPNLKSNRQVQAPIIFWLSTYRLSLSIIHRKRQLDSCGGCPTRSQSDGVRRVSAVAVSSCGGRWDAEPHNDTNGCGIICDVRGIRNRRQHTLNSSLQEQLVRGRRRVGYARVVF